MAMTVRIRKAFSLIEVLVVIASIVLLASILMPALVSARAQAIEIVCRSNLRQLVLANVGYANENNGSYVPAALDMFSATNNHRWHGVRDNQNEPFDPLKGPLVGYLSDGKVKKCPLNVDFRQGDPWEWNYEDGCGGYGYNRAYIGSRIWQSYTSINFKVTTKDSEVGRPAETLMFADTAMTELDENDRPYYLEYSFVIPRHFIINGKVDTTDSIYGTPSPSIHFRHRGKANVGWVDGHISSYIMAEFNGKNAYEVISSEMDIGWFGPLDNSKFDLK